MTCITALALLTCACATTHQIPVRAEVPPAPVPEAINPPATVDPAAVFIEAAQSMLGQPYRYGGAAPGGFDCSGLVVYAAHSAGIELPRTTQDLLRTGDPVERGDLRPGDLVFLHFTSKELHVGIALDAARFVHAPSSGGVVRIDDLGSTPYARAYLAARRLRFATP